MAPIKFEDNIREKLEDRKIPPSTGAWKKLSAQLPVKGEKKTDKVLWYAVAASFVGILIIAGLFFSRTSISSENKKELVETNNLEIESLKQDDNINPKVSNSEEINFNDLATEEQQTPEQKLDKADKIEKVTQRKVKSQVAIQKTEISSIEMARISNVDLIKEKQKLDKNKINSSEDNSIDEKVNEVVAQIEKLKKENTTITSEEIDVLLTNAQREIQSKRVLNSKKVDPAALLGDVEWELDKSFRDKVYDALSDGFVIIKTAVVERNN